jgi:antirestriction protein ArdC
MSNSVTQQIREETTKKIVDALTTGNVVPWRKPWNEDPNCGYPRNIVSKRKYRGINPLLLELTAMSKGYRSCYWATYKQFAEAGGQVRKGEKSTTVVFSTIFQKDKVDASGNTVLDKNGKKAVQKLWFLKTFAVFNLDQVDGEKLDKYRPMKEVPGVVSVSNPNYAAADEVIASTKADIRHGGNQPCYICPTPEGKWPLHTDGDYINCPVRTNFPDLREYYYTMFHELSHWSEIRTQRPNNSNKKSGIYAYNELVAEISACYLATELKIPQSDNLTNHTAYLKSWLQAMNDDPQFIFQASNQASKVVDFLLSFSGRGEQQGTDEQE